MKDISKLLKYLEYIWKKYPNYRLGEMLCNVCNYTSLYYITDEQLIEALCNTFHISIKNMKEIVDNNTDKVNDNKSKYKPNPAMKDIGASNKGRVYVHKGTDVKLIDKTDLEIYSKAGYTLGRKDK